MDETEWEAQMREIGTDPSLSKADQIKIQLLAEILICQRRMLNQSEAVEDAEPGPFQTLNGPSQ